MKPPQATYRRLGDGTMGWAGEARLSDMVPWRATIAGVRDASLSWRVTAVDFLNAGMDLDPVARLYMPTSGEVENVSHMMRDAIVYGRMIDFGHLPNPVLKEGGIRGGPMFNRGVYGQPFREPWVLYHTWDWDGADSDPDLDRNVVAIYLVNPVGDGDVEVCELQPASFGSEKLLVISDRGLFQRHPSEELEDRKYIASVAPSQMRFANGEMGERMNNGGKPDSAAAGNIGDPLMTALMILNTRNVERETVQAPEKLQRARKKSGKPLIPSFDRVNTVPYVTAILARGRRRSGDDLGGHHASPMPHIRRGHVRVYATGQSTFIRDTLVNVADEARAEFLRTRSHYAVKP